MNNKVNQKQTLIEINLIKFFLLGSASDLPCQLLYFLEFLGILTKMKKENPKKKNKYNRFD